MIVLGVENNWHSSQVPVLPWEFNCTIFLLSGQFSPSGAPASLLPQGFVHLSARAAIYSPIRLARVFTFHFSKTHDYFGMKLQDASISNTVSESSISLL